MKKKMTIIVIAEIDFPEGMAATAHISLMVKGFLQNGYSSLLVIPSKSFNGHQNSRYSYTEGKYKGIPYIFFNRVSNANNNKYTFNSLRNVMDLANFLKKRKKNNKDAILIYTTDFLKYFPIYIVCKKNKIPLFLWEVEKRTANRRINSFRSVFQLVGNCLSENILPKISNGIVVISSYLKDYYSKRIDKSRIMISPILVDEHFPKKKINIKKISPTYELISKKKNKKIIVYSGSFGEKDGFIYILYAFRKILRVYPESLLVTTGKPSKYNPIENILIKTKKLGINKNFIYLGLLSRDELEFLNKNADLLLVCRSNSDFARHGFPWKLGEYLMTKNPILATRVGDIENYLVEDEEIILAEPEDIESIYRKMKEIFNDYDRAQQIALNGYKKAIDIFNYEKGSKRVFEFIVENSGILQK